MNYYYSGQGSLYVGGRTATGKPAGLLPVGNVPELTIDIETTNFEHKESESGQRLVDLVIVKEKKGKFAFKLENLSLDNLALGLFGTKASIAAGSVVDEEVELYKSAEAGISMRNPLAKPDVSTVVVTSQDGDDADTFAITTAYALGDYVIPITPNGRYYKVTAAGTSAGTEPTWPTTFGGTVVSGTVTFTDMGKVIRDLTTDYTVDAKNGVIIVPSTAGIESGRVHLIDYANALAYKMDAFTVQAPEKYLRFEGLNTVDGSRVIVDIFKGQFDPLTGYGLIVEELSAADMKGTILADALQTGGGSLYFRQMNVSA
jgi:hypothetical protein